MRGFTVKAGFFAACGAAALLAGCAGGGGATRSGGAVPVVPSGGLTASSAATGTANSPLYRTFTNASGRVVYEWTVNEIIPVDDWYPFFDPCSGEWVRLSGTEHYSFTSQVVLNADNSGGTTSYRQHGNFQGVKAIGVISGREYVFVDEEKQRDATSTFVWDTGNSFTAHSHDEQTYALIAKGDTAKYHWQLVDSSTSTYVFTIDPVTGLPRLSFTFSHQTNRDPGYTGTCT